MTSKPVVLRSLAQQDLEAAIDYYVQAAGAEIALNFIDAVERTHATLNAHPAAGSTRYAFELSLPGLRSLSLKRFPYLVFYAEGDAQIEIWRILHAQREIPTQMRGLEEE